MGGFRITVADRDESFMCDAEQDVLSAMLRHGRHDIAVGCRGGGCGACRVQVLSGAFRTRKMSRAQVSVEDAAAGIALACKLLPSEDLVLQALGRKAAMSD